MRTQRSSWRTNALGFDQVADHLAHEEGVAFGLGMEHLRRRFGGRIEVVARERLQHGPHLVGIEAPQRHPLHPGLLAERSKRLRQRVGAHELGVAVGRDHQQRERSTGAHQVAEVDERGLVGPMEVVEHEHHRRLAGGVGHERVRRVEQTQAVGLRVSRDDRRCVGDARQQRRRPPGEPGAPLLAVVTEHILRGMQHEMLDGLGQRLVRRPDVLVTAAEQHDRAL